MVGLMKAIAMSKKQSKEREKKMDRQIITIGVINEPNRVFETYELE